MSRRFRLLALILTFVMLFAVTGVAQAHGSKDSKHYSKMFGDTAIEDCDWAFKYIEQLGTLGVIKGDEHGRFNGNSTINHQEAVTMIVRFNDLEAEAIAHAGQSVPLLDGNKIASWARGYVNVALDHDLLWLPDSSVITSFNPTNPTTRLEAVVMLVKAADLEAEATAKMNTVLTFKDAHLIPRGLIGYVAVATEKQLVKGYNDNTFQPNKPVTRAEMATFLGRGIEQIPAISLGKSAEGTLVAVTATTLTLKVHGVQVLINVKTDAPVYRNDKPVALTQLVVGDKVEVKFDTTGTAVFIDAKGDNDDEDDDDHNPGTPTSGTTGTLKSITVINSPAATLVTITPTGATAEKTYLLAANAVIKVNGTVKTVADLLPGDSVTIKTGAAGDITELLVTRTVAPTVFTGTVKSILSVSNVTIATITLDGTAGDKTYTFAANCPVKIDNVTKTAADLLAGDKVSFKTDTAGTQITELTATRVTATVYTGTVKTVLNAASLTVATITLDGTAGDKTYTFVANCPVKIDNVTKTAADLLAGDKVSFKTDSTGAQITELTAVRNVVTSATGAISGINYQGRTLTLGTGSTAVTYTVATNAEIKFLGAALAWDQVALNDTVALTITNNVVTKVDVTIHAVTLNGIVKSTNTDAAGHHFVLTVGTTDYTVDVPASAVITENGGSGSFSSIVVGYTAAVIGTQSAAHTVTAAMITVNH